MVVKFTLHQLDNKDPNDTWRGYAIMPDDATEGFLIGDVDGVRALAKRLNRFLEKEKHDGAISSLDERLGWKWLDISDALKLATERGIPIAAPTVRLACANGKIADAKLDGKTWRFPRATFLGWLMNGSHKRGRPYTDPDIVNGQRQCDGCGAWFPAKQVAHKNTGWLCVECQIGFNREI